MAKKNIVHLVGYMEDIIDNKDDRLFFHIGIRKNANKFVHPIIEISKSMHPQFEQLEKGKLIIIEGSIKTEDREQFVTCPHCERQLLYKYVFTTVLAQKLFILDTNQPEIFINSATLLGVVINGQEFKLIQSTYSEVGNMKYQIAVNRAQRELSDRPWISTFNVQAETDAKRLQTGSQILVEGSLNTRYATKKLYCECEEVIDISEPQTEVMGKTVEYLNNCLFPENEQQ